MYVKVHPVTVSHHANGAKRLRVSHLSESFPLIECQIGTLAQREDDGGRGGDV